MLFAGVAILHHFQPFLQDLLILVGKIVDGLALGAFKLDHVVLGHKIQKRQGRDSLKLERAGRSYLQIVNYSNTINKNQTKVK